MMNMFNANDDIDPLFAEIPYNPFDNGGLVKMNFFDIDNEENEINYAIGDDIRIFENPLLPAVKYTQEPLKDKSSSENAKVSTDIMGIKKESKIQDINDEIEEIPNINDQPIDSLCDKKPKFLLRKKRVRRKKMFWKKEIDIENTTIGQMLLDRETETNILKKLRKLASSTDEEIVSALELLFKKSDADKYPGLKGGKNYERFEGEVITSFLSLTKIMIEKGYDKFNIGLKEATEFFADKIESIENEHAKCGIVTTIKFLAKREEEAPKGTEKPFMDKLKGMREKYKSHSHSRKVDTTHCFACRIRSLTKILKKTRTPKAHRVKNVNGLEKEN